MIGVVADDTTGANDIGVMYARNGLRTAVVAHDAPGPFPAEAEVVILDTDSRLDSPAIARGKVIAATRRLRACQATPLHKKTCSVFRGNIGAEFDAMLEAAGGDFMVVSVAYPRNGRQTHHAVHSVNGVPLAETAFAGDPVHPMTESNLCSILRAQTSRPVENVPLEMVRSGPPALRAALQARQRVGGYAIVDAMDQKDLSILAEAAGDFPFFGGSSALAEELSRANSRSATPRVRSAANSAGSRPVLIVSGSLTPQTRTQTAACLTAGTPAVRLDSVALLGDRAGAEIERAATAAEAVLRAGRDVLLLADNDASRVAATKTAGAKMGLDELTVSKRISAALAEAAHRLVGRTGVSRLVVAGGDTAGTVTRRLGITGNWILDEIETGVPAGLALNRPLLLVLKSGSFGSAEFLLKAAAHLRSLDFSTL